MNQESTFDVATCRRLTKICLPIRDMSQSEYGNILDISHDKLLSDVYPLIADFNRAGELQIDMVETPCGAQPQVDVFRGRHPLESMKRIHRAMPLDVAARILVRGPFGVGLSPLSGLDLFCMLESMAKASGALSGRHVIFKVFEAQNNPSEKAATFQIVGVLRVLGYQVSIEDAICYTADKAFQVEEYKAAFAESLSSIDALGEWVSGLLVTSSLKDMIGGLGEEGGGEVADTSLLVRGMVEVLDAHQKEDVVIGVHSHHTGFSLSAYCDGIVSAWSSGRTVRVDALPLTCSFLSIVELCDSLSKTHVVGGVSLLTEEQRAIVMRMADVLESVRREYHVAKIDMEGLSGEIRRRYKIPGGAVPSTVRLFIQPLAAKLSLSEEEARERLLAQMELAWHELGKPHAVTPGAKFLAQTAYHLVVRSVEAERAGWELSRAELYMGLPLELLDYWRGAMPGQPDPDVFHVICSESLSRLSVGLFEGQTGTGSIHRLLVFPTNKEKAGSALSSMGLGLSGELRSRISESGMEDLLKRDQALSFFLSLKESASSFPWLSQLDFEGSPQFKEWASEAESVRGQLEACFASCGLSTEEGLEVVRLYTMRLDSVGTRLLPISYSLSSRSAHIVAELSSFGVPFSQEEMGDHLFVALLFPEDARGRIDVNVQKLLLTPRVEFPQEWEGPFHEDPGFVAEETGSLEFGAPLKKAALFWRLLAQRQYQQTGEATTVSHDLFFSAFHKIEQPEVASLILSQKRWQG